jgi:hypothetical protein
MVLPKLILLCQQNIPIPGLITATRAQQGRAKQADQLNFNVCCQTRALLGAQQHCTVVLAAPNAACACGTAQSTGQISLLQLTGANPTTVTLHTPT